jgi:hypothetical protein
MFPGFETNQLHCIFEFCGQTKLFFTQNSFYPVVINYVEIKNQLP